MLKKIRCPTHLFSRSTVPNLYCVTGSIVRKAAARWKAIVQKHGQKFGGPVADGVEPDMGGLRNLRLGVLAVKQAKSRESPESAALDNSSYR